MKLLRNNRHFSLPFKGKVACDVCDWRVGEGMGDKAG
jgi:hypothetical protein